MEVGQDLDLGKIKEKLAIWGSLKPFVKKIMLFGSRVSGISHKSGQPPLANSDLDVAVEIEPIGNDDNSFTSWISEAKNWEEEISKLLNLPAGIKIDLQRLDHDTPHTNERIPDIPDDVPRGEVSSQPNSKI